MLHEEALKSIAACEVIIGDECQDELVWDGSTHESFPVKSTLKIVRSEGSEISDGLWRQIWRLKVPQRMRFFI